jgi:carbon storage regulator
MLVLSRRQGECIIINDNIRVRIIRVQGGTVRLGIEAPAEVPVLRSELSRRPAPQEPEPAGR